MSHYAYLRVSTDRQDVDNQKHGILEYCNDRHIAGLEYVRDGAGGKVKWWDRQIGKLLTEMCRPGDTRRPKGKAEKVKLDANEAEILGYLEKQVSKRAIAKILGCVPSMLYEWLERQGLNTYKRAGGSRLKGRLALPLDNRMPGHS